MAQDGTRAWARRQTEQEQDPYGWRQECQDLLRAVTGGAIVGMPLLYTMEMWWQGMLLSEWHLLAILGAILLVNFLFSLFSGFRPHYSPGEALSEAVTAVGIGILFSAAILGLIGEIRAETGAPETVGKILIEAAAVSVGVSFANAQVRGKSRTGEEGGGPPAEEDAGSPPGQERGQEDPERRQLRADLNDAGATMAGATVFSLNIAPTEEVIMIATRLSPWQQLAVLGAAFLLCYVILFASGFEEHRVYVPSVFQHPLAETTITCAISLLVAGGLLLLLGQTEATSHLSTLTAAVITLGLPAVVGGAAGRLIV